MAHLVRISRKYIAKRTALVHNPMLRVYLESLSMYCVAMDDCKALQASIICENTMDAEHFSTTHFFNKIFIIAKFLQYSHAHNITTLHVGVVHIVQRATGHRARFPLAHGISSEFAREILDAKFYGRQ